MCVCLAVGLMRPGVEQFVWVRQLVAKEQRADSHSLSHTHTAAGAGMGCQRRVNREKDRQSQREREGGRERRGEEGATKQSFMRAGRRPAQSIFGSAPLLIVLSV